MTKPALRSVPSPAAEPQPSYAYEAEQRRRIAAKDWARIHVAADRRAPLSLSDRVKRLWR